MIETFRIRRLKSILCIFYLVIWGFENSGLERGSLENGVMKVGPCEYYLGIKYIRKKEESSFIDKKYADYCM